MTRETIAIGGGILEELSRQKDTLNRSRGRVR